MDFSGAAVGERVRDGFGVPGEVPGVSREVLGEFVGEWGEQPAGTLSGLVEGVCAEVPDGEKLQYVAFDEGAQRFEEVEGEAVAVLLVGVHDAESGVEPERDGGEAAFGFGEGVAVVEQGVDGVGGGAWGSAASVQGAGAGGEGGPVLRDALGIPLSESTLDRGGPGAEVGVADLGFQLPAAHEAVGVAQLVAELADQSGDGPRRQQLLSERGLPVEFGAQQTAGDLQPDGA